MTAYASYPLPSELPTASVRRQLVVAVLTGIVMTGWFVRMFVSRDPILLDPTWGKGAKCLVGLAYWLLLPAGFAIAGLIVGSYRRHVSLESAVRHLAVAVGMTAIGILAVLAFYCLADMRPKTSIAGYVMEFICVTVVSLAAYLGPAVPLSVGAAIPVVRFLNRREAAALRQAQRRYFDGREKQLRQRMALAVRKPWRGTSRGFHLTAAVCGGVCTAGLTAAALLITCSSFLGRGDSELGYALVVLLVWPALVVCIGAKVLGCGVTRTWKEGSMLAVFAYIWSVATFTVGALAFHMAESGRLALDKALMFGIACAFFGAIFSLIPCLIAIAGCAVFDNVRNCHANSTQRPQRGKQA